ncbi:monovalent cation/H(+) antiporter subunit G [Bartonella tamiae]|uniref:Monovalent cation/proton antiporter, MnhG/PhaG subunit n=1 Tax=Bartonella tamiae Th239 TaxID=1094558 RepID=J1K387_9HYPH|nr:monovalent cation/H(+) antiporter subunit G [Bartonella tamiae]EJF91585.1 monovalent cation/proton antiporter, MnhG/PhaG subunit [Bartonella tamiae Th239]EJF92431.1 monovalent cation/proton antiporter, MnhG/PhaG subunit [Bartonella tamiae Th307]
MNEDLPLWLAIIIVTFLLWGSALTLIGAIGLTRAKTFYERLHMPTLGTSWGVGGIIIASMIYSTFIEHRLVIHELLLTFFILVTTPVTLMLLSRAAMHRDHTENWREISRKTLPHRPEDIPHIHDIKDKVEKTE